MVQFENLPPPLPNAPSRPLKKQSCFSRGISGLGKMLKSPFSRKKKEEDFMLPTLGPNQSSIRSVSFISNANPLVWLEAEHEVYEFLTPHLDATDMEKLEVTWKRG